MVHFEETTSIIMKEFKFRSFRIIYEVHESGKNEKVSIRTY